MVHFPEMISSMLKFGPAFLKFGFWILPGEQTQNLDTIEAEVTSVST
jgi:hypothetical protein